MKKLRFSKDNLILPCFCDYYGDNRKTATVPKSCEVLTENGEWKPHPIVEFIDDDETLMTVALIRQKDGVYEMASTDGVPDSTLFLEAEKAGVLTVGFEQRYIKKIRVDYSL